MLRVRDTLDLVPSDIDVPRTVLHPSHHQPQVTLVNIIRSTYSQRMVNIWFTVGSPNSTWSTPQFLNCSSVTPHHMEDPDHLYLISKLPNPRMQKQQRCSATPNDGSKKQLKLWLAPDTIHSVCGLWTLER